MVNDALGAAATEAIRAFSSEITVVVNPRGSPANLGSGILIYRDAGSAFVLTAAHVVEGNALPINIGVAALGPKNRIRDAVAAIHFAPPVNGRDIDVAVLLLTDAAKAQVAKFGAPYRVVGPGPDLEDDDFIVDETGRGQLDVDVVQLFYETTYKGRDGSGRICVAWGEAIVSAATTTATRPGWVPDKLVKLGSPVGISGAGLWRFNKARGDEIWSPRTHGQLLGVAVAWNSIDTQYCDETEQFAGWLATLV
jgi:hypothetical protein